MPEMTPEERCRIARETLLEVLSHAERVGPRDHNEMEAALEDVDWEEPAEDAEAPLRAEIDRLREVVSECRTRLGAYGLSVASCNLMRRIEFVMREQPSDSALQERDSHKDQRIAALEAVIQGICYCGALDKTDPGKCDFCNVGTSTLEARDSRMKREGAREALLAAANEIVPERYWAPGREEKERMAEWLRDRAEKLEKPA